MFEKNVAIPLRTSSGEGMFANIFAKKSLMDCCILGRASKSLLLKSDRIPGILGSISDNLFLRSLKNFSIESLADKPSNEPKYDFRESIAFLTLGKAVFETKFFTEAPK